MRRPGLVVALCVLVLLIALGIAFGGRFEDWLLRMHGMR
jgi:hypothetical protein